MKDVVNWNLYVKILVIACIAVVGSVFPVLITTSVGKEFYNKQSKMFENQIKIQAKHYEELANNSLEIRRFKHDYNNMLIGVQLLLKNGDILGATEMLNSGRGIIFGGAESEFDTGNSIVDAILTEKQAKAAESNSVICFEGAVPARCIDPSDLCVIFCNTIDNAIEACEKIKAESKNEIKIVCRSVSGFTFMNISNPTKDNIKAYNNMIKTTKADKHEHGLGLYSLRKAIDNYDGEMTLMCDNNIFTVDIELDLTSRIA